MEAASPLARLLLSGLVLAALLGTGGCTGHLAERWVNRIVAEGPYVDGERHGPWTLRWPYGLVAEGSYVRGVERGRWAYRYPDGRCHVAIYSRSGRKEVERIEEPVANAAMVGGHVFLKSLEPKCNPPGLWLITWLDSKAKAKAAEAGEEALGLTREQRRRIQASLTAAGFDPGPANGVFSPRTRMALMSWQAARSYEVTGYLAKGQTLALLGWR